MQDSISEEQYCSEACLLGLATDTRSKIDPSCPNAAEHGQRHLRRSDFKFPIQGELTYETSSSCLAPLNVSGSRGSLFKLSHPSHGYVLLAKGVQQDDECHLLNEAKIYGRLAPIQGKYIPVCIGGTTLSHPLILSGGRAQPTKIITGLLFVSYAGIPMERCLNETNKDMIAQGIEDCMKAIHALGVLHTDAFPNNILLHDGGVRIIDFDRSTTREKVAEEEKQEWAKQGEKSIDKQSPREEEEEGMSLWEARCEKELRSAEYPARTSTWLHPNLHIFSSNSTNYTHNHAS